MGLREDLAALTIEGTAAFAAAATQDALETARIAFLGTNGREKDLTKAFGALPGPEKREFGPLLNQAKTALKEAFEAAKTRLADVEADAPIDLTLPGPVRRQGSLHPVSQVSREVEEVFTSMGYEIADGPHIELDEFNFSRLNIPADHPARDHQDTFWLLSGGSAAGAAESGVAGSTGVAGSAPVEAGAAPPLRSGPGGPTPPGSASPLPGKLLRTHTSAVQSRVYPKVQPPFRKVVVGKVFRYEAVDATHDNTFTQVEGFVVDTDITVAHLVGTIRTMLTALLKRDDVEVRLRPSFFPFVEPGFEVDVRLTQADPASRFSRWVELMGCGMIHPEVLTAGGIDPTRFQGFAFGLGMERLVMLRHGITDIRVFHGADLRSLRQFGN